MMEVSFVHVQKQTLWFDWMEKPQNIDWFNSVDCSVAFVQYVLL